MTGSHLSEDELRVFQNGQRLTVGGLHDGMLVQDCFPVTEPSRSRSQSASARHSRSASASSNTLAGLTGTKRLEIVRKLGSGSYAVVYLCRAILYDPVEDGSEADDFDDFDMDDDEHHRPARREIVYGQEFALKCLCKRNLSEDLLHVQRFEVCHFALDLGRY